MFMVISLENVCMMISLHHHTDQVA